MYLDSVRRWGDNATSKYEWPLFERLAELPDQNVTLWLAEHEGIPISGALCLYSAKHVGYWSGAALESHLHLRSTSMVVYDAIRDACERGFSWFDFNPSGGHEGVRKFKEHFGCQELPCPSLTWESTRSRLARRVRSLVGV
jgi:lipid II:glycine glycyltransferase (peptidoglycan interpeptide bridge formation enzyme)